MLGNLAKSANEKRVAIRSIKAKHVEPWSARSEVNLLPNSKDRSVHRNLQKPGCLSIDSRGIDLFVGMADLDFIVVLQYGEQRNSVKPGFFETGELISREVTGLDGARFVSAEPQAFELNQRLCSGQRESRSNFLLRMRDAEREHFRSNSHASAGHLLCVTHQFVEMDLRRSDEGPGTAAAHDHTLALQSGERMPGRHQADAMNLRQLALRVHEVAWPQESALQPLHNRALDLFVRGQPVPTDVWHYLTLPTKMHLTIKCSSVPAPILRVFRRRTVSYRCTVGPPRSDVSPRNRECTAQTGAKRQRPFSTVVRGTSD